MSEQETKRIELPDGHWADLRVGRTSWKDMREARRRARVTGEDGEREIDFDLFKVEVLALRLVGWSFEGIPATRDGLDHPGLPWQAGEQLANAALELNAEGVPDADTKSGAGPEA